MRNLWIVLLTFVSFGISAQQLNPGILIEPNKSTVHENAIKYYSGIIERNPTDVKSILLRSELYKALNMNDEAAADVSLAMAINPYSNLYLNKTERSNFFERRNYSYDNINNVSKDVNFIKSYVLADEYDYLIEGDHIPENTKSLFEIALIAIEKDDFEVAEKMLWTISHIDGELPMYHDVKGILQLENGEIEESIESFTKAIAKDSSFTLAFHNRAVAYKMLGNLEEAERNFSIALNQRIDLAKLSFSKAKVLEMQGDTDGARYFYENAISSKDDYPEARLNYSVLLKASGDYTRALIEINSLIEEYPNNPDNYYVRGGLHFVYGEYRNAVKDFDMYLDIKPDDLDVVFYRGLCLVMDGSIERGCVDINNSMESGSNNYDDIYLFMCE